MTIDTIEPKILKYINTTVRIAVDKTVTRALKESDIRITTYMSKYMNELNAENTQHMEALRETFHDDVKVLAELIQDRPTRNEARIIAREETEEALRPVNAKLDFLNEERKEMLEILGEIKA